MAAPMQSLSRVMLAQPDFASLVLLLFRGCCFSAATPVAILCVAPRSPTLCCQDQSLRPVSGMNWRGWSAAPSSIVTFRQYFSAWSSVLPQVAIIDTRSSPPSRQTLSDARFLPRLASVAHSQPWRKFLQSCEIESGSGLGTKLGHSHPLSQYLTLCSRRQCDNLGLPVL